MSVRAVSPEEMGVVQLYTQQGVVGEFRRVREFAKGKGIEVRLKEEMALSVFAGGISGAVIALAYACYKLRRNPSDSPNFPKYAILGGAIGASVGGCTFIDSTRITIVESREYQEWKSQAVRNKVLPLFLDFVRESEEFKDLVCPISKELIEVPVRAADGFVYEKACIDTHIDTEMRKVQSAEDDDTFGRLARRLQEDPALVPLTFAERYRHYKAIALNRTSPFRKCQLRKEDLVYDLSYHQRVFDRIREVYNRNLDENVRSGLFSYSQMAINQRAQITAAKVDRLLQKFQNNEMDTDTYMRMHGAILKENPLVSPIPE